MTAPDCASCGSLARRTDLHPSGWACPEGCGEVRPGGHPAHLQGWPPGSIRAVCPCGWTGHWYRHDYVAAQRDAEAHRCAVTG